MLPSITRARTSRGRPRRSRAERLARAFHEESRQRGASLGEILGEVLASREATLELIVGMDPTTRARVDVAFDHVVAVLSSEYALAASRARGGQSIAAGTMVRPSTA